MSVLPAPAPPRHLFWRLAGFYAAYCLAIGIYMPYWPLWLDGKGLSSVEIGWVLAAAFWIKIAAQPTIARIADWRGRTRGLTTGLMALSAVGFVVIAGAEGFWPLLIIAGVTAAFYQPVLPVMESVVLRHVDTHRLDYGRIRLWGSVTFIIGTTGIGWWIEGGSATSVVWIMAGAMALVAVSCAIAPDRPAARTASKAGSLGLTKLFSTPWFLLFLATTAMINTSHAVLYGFATLYWRDLGHGETLIGVFWAVGVVAEILLFAIAGRFRDKLGAVPLLLLAALGGAVRWPLLAITESAAGLLALQTLHGLTFGAGHLGAMAFLSRSIPSELSATGQSLYYALIGGVVAGLMFPLAGQLYGDLGADAFLVMGGLSAGGFIGALWLSRIWRPATG
ncbi:MAG: MFS transporter [Alphaproteobacteria bacterium]|nr:MFS transporter [Alphaproteobacteria bacterium]